MAKDCLFGKWTKKKKNFHFDKCFIDLVWFGQDTHTQRQMVKIIFSFEANQIKSNIQKSIIALIMTHDFNGFFICFLPEKLPNIFVFGRIHQFQSKLFTICKNWFWPAKTKKKILYLNSVSYSYISTTPIRALVFGYHLFQPNINKILKRQSKLNYENFHI